MRHVIFAALVLLPAPALAERMFKVTLDGHNYTVRVVTDEPSGHLMEAPMYLDDKGEAVHGEPLGLDEGPFSPAVRVGGMGDHDLDTAIRAMSAVCGFDYDKVKDWGAYGDPVWFDTRTSELVFWTDCPRD